MMTEQFPRTKHIHTTDNFHTSTVSLLVVVILLTVWIAWFFGGTIQLHGMGTISGWAHDGQIVAELPIETLTRIRHGQTARLYLDQSIAPEQEAIPAIVTSLDFPPSSQTGQITLVPLRTLPLLDSTVNLAGEVQIDLEQPSPAALVMDSTH